MIDGTCAVSEWALALEGAGVSLGDSEGGRGLGVDSFGGGDMFLLKSLGSFDESGDVF